MSGYRKFRREFCRFEWANLTEDMNVSKIYFVNLTRFWYHDCIEEIIKYLTPRLANNNVTFVGVSMGGYAALLFAHLFNGSSISIGPQTNLNTDFKKKYDNRWNSQISKVAEATKYKDYLDISFVSGKHHHIYYSQYNKEDSINAERMDVTLHPLHRKSHDTAYWMKRHGLLKKVLQGVYE